MEQDDEDILDEEYIPLSKVKTGDFDAKYKAAFLEMRSRPYYDVETDEKAAIAYYAQIVSPPTFDSLNELVFSTYSHAKRRVNLFPVVDRHPDGSLRCVYSNQLLEDNQCNRFIKCNEEHCLPQSWHEGSITHPGADMHQLFASGTSANSFRKNLPFGKGDGPPSTEKEEYGKIYSANGNFPSVFLPKFNHGPCARATLYIFVVYKASVHPERFPITCLPWLIETAVKEPVTLWEKHRNAELFRLQGNRNPFIDHPEWAQVIDFNPAFSLGREITKQLKQQEKEKKREMREEKKREREETKLEREERKREKKAKKEYKEAKKSEKTHKE